MPSRSRSQETIISRLAGAARPFKARWAAYRTSVTYRSDGPDIHIVMLSEQVARIAARGEWNDLAEFFEALEGYAVHRQLHVARVVAVGVLLDTIEDLELLEVDLRQFFERLGPGSRQVWCDAYRNGHGGAEWENRPSE
jgi:hypothetical protein